MRGLQATSGTPITQPNQSPARYRIVMAGIIVVCYLLDQITKASALAKLSEPISLIGDLLTLELFFNSGAAFSMGARLTVVFSTLALIVLVALVTVFFWRVKDWLAALGVALLTAGVAGNLTDRIIRPPGIWQGHVVDFISLKGFAVFNVADMAISSAAVLIVWWSLRDHRAQAALAQDQEAESATESVVDSDIDQDETQLADS